MDDQPSDLYGQAPMTAEQPGVQSFVGNDIMVAAPTSLEQAIHAGEFAAAQENGMTSFTQHDVDMAMLRVENLVKEMQASGATQEEVLAAVGHYGGGDPALTAMVQDAASKQYAANENPFAPAQGQGQQPAGTMQSIGEVVFGVAAEKYVLDDNERGLNENGRPLSTGEVLAAMGAAGGFTPDNTPAQQRQRGMGMGMA
jgi:hypothetical protein